MPYILLILGITMAIAAQKNAFKIALNTAGGRFKTLLSDAENKYLLPRNLLARVAYQESSFNPDAYNVATTASGLMQIVPRWHPEIVDPFNPSEAIPYAAKYLRELYDKTGSWKMALAAYNWGIGNLQKYGIQHAPEETRNYVAQISHDVLFV